jgi:uncharacterized protein YodC (DUF2158 family)
MKTEFEPGDIVMLKSGGPMMTVGRTEDDEVYCIYFTPTGIDGLYMADAHRDSFNKDAIVGLED